MASIISKLVKLSSGFGFSIVCLVYLGAAAAAVSAGGVVEAALERLT
jgi:hypothetical protein